MLSELELTFARRWAAGLRPYASLSTALPLAAAGVAVALLAYRFANFDLVPFINDEPLFLDGARQQLVTGSWRSVSTLVGNQGVPYGPTAFWFYGVVHALFGPAPEVHILAMCLLLTIAHLTLAVVVSRVVGAGLLGFSAVLALFASSPYQFFWSRLAWDQVVNACAALAVVLLCARGAITRKRALALGVVLGLATSSHLMAIALVGIAFGALVIQLAIELKPTPRELAGRLSIALTGFLIVNIPYFSYLAGHPVTPSPWREAPLRVLGDYFMQPIRVATVMDIRYFFDSLWDDFVSWSGQWGTLWASMDSGVLASVITGLVADLTTAGLVLLSISKESHLRRLGLLGAAIWLSYSVLYATRTIDPHPHYQFPTYWIVPVGIAGLIAALRTRWSSAAAGVTAGVWVLAALQFVFVWQWMGYIRERDGTPAIHYDSPVSVERQIVFSLCQAPQRSLFVQNETATFPYPLLYLASTEPSCAGKQINFCPAGTCPPPSEAVRTFRLHYARPNAGALVLD